MTRRLLRAWVEIAVRHAVLVLVAALLGGLAALEYARTNLGVNTDTADMISERLAWRQTYIAYTRAFPDGVDLVVAVIDAPHPEAADAMAEDLVARLGELNELVAWAGYPEERAFLRRNGLLFLTPDELDDLSARLSQAQPLLAAMAASPSLETLFELLARAVPADSTGPVAPLASEMGAVVERLAGLAAAVAAGDAGRWSWRDLLVGSPGQTGAAAQESASPDSATKGARRLVAFKPRLDFEQLFPLDDLLDALHPIITDLERSAAEPVRIRLTGGLAMSHEELKSVSRGMGSAGIGALILVLVVLTLGLRSAGLVVACLFTLGVGLCLTAAFAAAVVGSLNLISVAFAVLYIGLGVDYAIHYALKFREALQQGASPARAIEEAGEDVGGALALCAVTTGVGFYAFVPTHFSGVAELGLISGTAMFISFAVTLTVMPATLHCFYGQRGGNEARRARVDFPGGGMLAAPVSARGRATIRVVSLLIAVASLCAVPFARFDDNPLNLRAPAGEALSTYRDLLADSHNGAWSMLALAPGNAEAEALARKLSRLEEVSDVRHLGTFVPAMQVTKLEMVDELALTLALDARPVRFTPADPARLDIATRALLAVIDDVQGPPQSLSQAAWGRLAVGLRALLEGAPSGSLSTLELRLMSGLPAEIERLRESLNAAPVRIESLPDSIRARWRSAQGTHLVEALPAVEMERPAERDRFVDAVLSVAPAGTGTPLVHRESGRAVVVAFEQAFASALVVIFLLLTISLRSVADSLLVLSPLALALLFTGAVMVLADQPFNFANIITLPLLLGIGVDNGVHMMKRIRSRGLAALPGSCTTRAVVVSALTTMASFGNLAFSPHPGTASMGWLLSIGMALMLFCTLVVMPCLVPAEPAAGAAAEPRT